MDQNVRRALVAASVAALLASTAAIFGQSVQAQEGAEDHDEGKVACYGINKCKGTGDCGGKGHGCAGKNACSGQGFVDLDKDICLRIKDGRLTPETS